MSEEEYKLEIKKCEERKRQYENLLPTISHKLMRLAVERSIEIEILNIEDLKKRMRGE